MKQYLSAFALLVTFSLTLQAQDLDRVVRRTRIAKQSSTITGDRGSFTVSSSEVLNKGQYAVGIAWNNFDRTPKDIDVNSFPVYASFGLFSRLSISGMVETHKEIVANNLAQPGYNNSLPFVTTRFGSGIGDTVISAKFKLQRKKDNIGGMSLRGFVKLPSADANRGLGTGSTDVGADLLFTTMLPLNVLMHSSLGFVSTSDATSPAASIRDEMRSGIAALWPSTGIEMGDGVLQGIFEYSTQTFVGCCSAGNPVASPKIQNATDITGGLRYLWLDTGLSFDLGYRINKGFDETDPNNKDRRGFIAGISYTRPDAAGVTQNRTPVVSALSDVAEINATGVANLSATAFDADGDILGYTWTTTGGQIVGNGARATFRAAGATPGRYTIRVLVTDGKNGTADAEVDISVR